MTRAPPTECPMEAINMKRISSIAISLAALALGVSSNSANAVVHRKRKNSRSDPATPKAPA